MPPSQREDTFSVKHSFKKKKRGDRLFEEVGGSTLAGTKYDLIYSAYPHCCVDFSHTPGLSRAAMALTKSFIFGAFGTSAMEVEGMKVSLSEG